MSFSDVNCLVFWPNVPHDSSVLVFFEPQTTDAVVLHPDRWGPEGHRGVCFRLTLWEGWRWVSISVSIQRSHGPGSVQHDLVHCGHGAVEASQLLLVLPLGDAEPDWALRRAPARLSRRAGGQPSDGPRGTNLPRVAEGSAYRPGVTPSGATLSRYSFPCCAEHVFSDLLVHLTRILITFHHVKTIPGDQARNRLEVTVITNQKAKNNQIKSNNANNIFHYQQICIYLWTKRNNS